MQTIRLTMEAGADQVDRDPTPSRADLEMSNQVVQALGGGGITVHEHVIVSKNRHTSFKSQRLI